MKDSFEKLNFPSKRRASEIGLGNERSAIKGALKGRMNSSAGLTSRKMRTDLGEKGGRFKVVSGYFA